MNKFQTIKLENGINLVIKQNKNTPRIAVNYFIKNYAKEEKAGTLALISRLMMQGTKTRTAEALAEEIDFNALEIGVELKQDYFKIRALCLNEDIEKIFEIMQDIIKNSTFADVEKERTKLKGEISADLDSPKSKAIDNLLRNMYPNHPYGHSCTKVLEEIDSITKEDVTKYYDNLLNSNATTIMIVGDIDEKITEIVKKYFSEIQPKDIGKKFDNQPSIENNKIVTIDKEDASQAQIFQGWIVPGVLSEDYPSLILLNTILGSSGLSSRLFVELRDKKGLAYVVRSTYEPQEQCGSFSIYIATEPKNIKVSLEGFKEEIEKLQNIPVSEEELNSAKDNILGKRQFILETNSQQAHCYGYYDIIGLGVDFEKIFKERLKNVTVADIQKTAQKYLTDKSIVSILAPQKYLDVANI